MSTLYVIIIENIIKSWHKNVFFTLLAECSETLQIFFFIILKER